MKYLLIGFLVIGIALFNSKTTALEKSTQQQIQVKLDSTILRTNDGVYSLYDTSKGNCGIEAYKRFVYLSPILFLKNGHFIQSPYCKWPSPTLEEEIKNKNQRFDYGNYYFNGNKITLDGTFTFFARGMDWRQYKAKYVGYLDPSGDTLFLKLGEPYPKINLRFNESLAERLKDGSYQKYIFKPLSKSINLDEAFFDSISKPKPRLLFERDRDKLK